jgi:hypothetical protein
MSGRHSREKGRRFELEVCHRIEDATGQKAVRVLSEARDGNSGDIDCPTLPISWQAKCGARPDIYGAVKEAQAVADPKGLYAVAVVKRSGAGQRKPDELAVLPLADFLEIVKSLKDLGIW